MADIFDLLDSVEIDYARGGDTAMVALSDDVQVHITGNGDAATMVVWLMQLDPEQSIVFPRSVIALLTVSQADVLHTLSECKERYGA